MTWTVLVSANSTAPCPRREHGFTAIGSKLYVHGGRTGIQLGMINYMFVLSHKKVAPIRILWCRHLHHIQVEVGPF